MEVKADVETKSQLPFEIDSAVVEQIAEFRRQQQASLELDGPPSVGGEDKIDF